MDDEASNGIAPVDTPSTPTPPANSSTSSSTTSSVVECGSSSEEGSSSGCASSVAFTSLLGALAVAGVALFKKKKQ